jgi:hypothetical protein
VTTVNAVAATSPNNAQSAQSILCAPVPLGLSYSDRNSIFQSCYVAGAVRRREISLPRTLVASREKKRGMVMAYEFDGHKNVQYHRAG